MDLALELEIRDLFRAIASCDDEPVQHYERRPALYTASVGICDGPVFDAWVALAKAAIPHDLTAYEVGFFGRTGVWGCIGVAFEGPCDTIAYSSYFVQGEEAAAAWDAADEDPEAWLNMMLGATEWNVWELVQEG